MVTRGTGAVSILKEPTLNPKPSTPSPKPETPNPEAETFNPGVCSYQVGTPMRTNSLKSYIGVRVCGLNCCKGGYIGDDIGLL